MTIRDATVADAEPLARVQVASWRDAFRGILPDEYLDEAVSVDERIEDWRDFLAVLEADRFVLVAEDERGVVAFADAGRVGDERGELFALHVRPDRRGEGLGKTLLEAVVERFSAAEYRDAELWVLTDNVRARRFYEREGWSLEGSTKAALPGTTVEEIRYRGSIRSAETRDRAFL